MNILIPMAGNGQRFIDAGYEDPKFLIRFLGKPMIQHVIDNLMKGLKKIEGDHKIIFVIRKYDAYNSDLLEVINYIVDTYDIHPITIYLEKPTRGAAETCLAAAQYIDNGESLLIHDCDQIIDWDDNLYHLEKDIACDGAILVKQTDDLNYSFVRFDLDHTILQVAEKDKISIYGSIGAYYWSYGYDFVNFALRLIHRNIRTKNEFYVAPVYNIAIHAGYIFKAIIKENHYHVGTPEKLKEYIERSKVDYGN